MQCNGKHWNQLCVRKLLTLGYTIKCEVDTYKVTKTSQGCRGGELQGNKSPSVFHAA